MNSVYHFVPGRGQGGGRTTVEGRLVVEKVCTAEEALRYSLMQDIAALVVGIDSMDVLKQDLAIARNFKPFSDGEKDKLLARVKPAAGDGRHERFKSTQMFDGPYHQQQHGLTPKEVSAP